MAALVKYGQLCKTCKPGKCIDCPSTSQPAEIECPSCHEKGCDQCDDRGYLRITSCPKQYVGREISGLLTYADLYQKGLPPVLAGSLDQSNWFIEACHFLWAQESRLKSQLGIDK